MKLKLISCEVLGREALHCIEKNNVQVDIEYTEKSAHEKPELLRESIQGLIDKSEGYDAVLLGYGLCGNALKGIRAAGCKLVAPRAHDCCTLFLGSKNRFNELFDGRESMPWGSTGYCEKGDGYLRNSDTGSVIGYDRSYDEYVEKYGEENAAYIWSAIHPESESKDVLFIKIPETYEHDIFLQFEKEADENDRSVSIEQGNLSLIERLVSGNWDEDFLIIEPGNCIEAVYDRDEIICSQLARNDNIW